ncbi:MAG TPA: nicotinate-nucleotide--dimethylbenzimidazole phosphoribosyltransferase [Candidatus Binataceae bacterium]|jgi:nicotinate-nucleotide--dimethylbenzimidazole phosphoribosyltransferase|nr:nicotinate-nucleotide--dimethylbenzimidazole phosphoribosyltransferase [Candidatus Binataceae bacterium]
MSTLEETLAAIEAPSTEAARDASLRLDSLTKPRGSLGYLEEIVRRYAAIRHDSSATFGRGAVAVFVADHGIADAGVSAYPKAVTVEMLRNIGAGGAAISVLARRFGYELIVTDIGVETDTSATPLAGVRYRRVAAGTRNFLEGPAMTLTETRAAIEVGIETAREAAAARVTLLGIGEMGIANSTPAAAILAAVTGIEPSRVAGRGTGVDDRALAHKVEVIEAALRLHREQLGDGLTMLASIGGLELAAMTGACLGAAAARLPVVVDGFIATAAAAAADKISGGIYRHLLFSHRSAEGGHALALQAMNVRAMFDLDMRLGEGSGAAIAMSIIEAALALFCEMATFESAGVSEKIE